MTVYEARRSRLHRRLRLGERDAGFTMVEVGVAIGVSAIVFTLLIGSLGSGLRAMLVSSQRTAATAKANEIVERVRALSYDKVTMYASDLPGGDPDVTPTSPCSGLEGFGGESVIRSTTDPGAPLSPHHDVPFQSGSTKGRTSTYVTMVDENGDCIAEAKRLTVVATWQNAPGGVSNTVRVATLFSPFSRSGVMSSSAVVYPVELSASSSVTPATTTTIELPRQFAEANVRDTDNSTRGSSATASLSVGNTSTVDPVVTSAVTDDVSPDAPPAPEVDDPAPVGSTLAGGFVVGSAASTADVAGSSASERADHQGSAGLGATSLVSTTIPAVPLLPAITLALANAEFSSAVRAQRLASNGPVIEGRSTMSSPEISLLKVPAVPVLLPSGVTFLRIHAFTGSAVAQAGGTSDPTATLGNLVIDIYDPANVVSGTAPCTNPNDGVTCTHSGTTTTITINPSDPNMDLTEIGQTISVPVPGLACFDLAFTITQVPTSAPTAQKDSGGIVEHAEAHVTMPKIDTTLTVRTATLSGLPPTTVCGAGVATLSAGTDLGKIDASATKS